MYSSYLTLTQVFIISLTRAQKGHCVASYACVAIRPTGLYDTNENSSYGRSIYVFPCLWPLITTEKENKSLLSFHCLFENEHTDIRKISTVQ